MVWGLIQLFSRYEEHPLTINSATTHTDRQTHDSSTTMASSAAASSGNRFRQGGGISSPQQRRGLGGKAGGKGGRVRACWLRTLVDGWMGQVDPSNVHQEACFVL